MTDARLPDRVHVDGRWRDGGIARFGDNVLPLVRGVGSRTLTGRCKPARPSGQLEIAARFAARAARGGYLLSPGFAPPLGLESRSVVTVHDLHYCDPELAGGAQHWYFVEVVLRQLRRCPLVLTVSDSSADELRAALGDDTPVVVVGNGVDPRLVDIPRVSGEPRLLFVGGDKPNKNLRRALTAFARSGVQAELVVVGSVADELQRSAPPGVRFVGAVSERRLWELYASSTALLMPSLAEGFGLPALEAMAAGTPVICGDRHALPSVVGARGWAVDPFDDDEIASGIVAALEDPITIDGAERRALVDEHRWVDVAQRVRRAVEGVL